MMPVCRASPSPSTRSSASSNASIGFDWRLGPYDVEQSRAHATMLADAGIISAADRDALLAGLERVEEELESGSFPFREDDEDIHMAIERRLTEIAGPVGGKLHTARSRNDQVATDMALFTRAHALQTLEKLQHLQSGLVQLAERHEDWAMPGYTHLQRAQPVYLSHHLLAYFWMFRRDARRFEFVLGSIGDLPLGAGALAGVNFATDRGMLARELGFAGVVPNSIDAVSNRDFVLDFLSAAATCATHLSRLGAEIVLWSSQEFGFAEVADAWASGSSIMPQKKNPDAAELLRAKAPRVAAPARRPARRAARAPADLQQGHAGGQGAPVRRRGHARPLPAGRHRDARGDHASTASGWPRRPPTSSSRPRTSPTCWCAAASRSASRTASWPGWCARRSPPGGRCPASRARSWRRTPRRSTTSSTRCCPSARGWSRRCPRAGRRSPACASSWPTRAPSWTASRA